MPEPTPNATHGEHFGFGKVWQDVIDGWKLEMTVLMPPSRVWDQ